MEKVLKAFEDTLADIKTACINIKEAIDGLPETAYRKILQQAFKKTSLNNPISEYSFEDQETYIKQYRSYQNKIKPEEYFKQHYLDKFFSDNFYLMRFIGLAYDLMDIKSKGLEPGADHKKLFSDDKHLVYAFENLSGKDIKYIMSPSLCQGGSFLALAELLNTNHLAAVHLLARAHKVEENPNKKLLLPRKEKYQIADVVQGQTIFYDMLNKLFEIKTKYAGYAGDNDDVAAFFNKNHLSKAANLYHLSLSLLQTHKVFSRREILSEVAEINAVVTGNHTLGGVRRQLDIMGARHEVEKAFYRVQQNFYNQMIITRQDVLEVIKNKNGEKKDFKREIGDLFFSKQVDANMSSLARMVHRNCGAFI